MRKPIFVIIAVVAVGILILSGFMGSSGKAGSDWQKKIAWADPAMTKADIAAKGKPIYLFISTEWCTFCKKMKGETFADAKVQNLLNTLFTPLTINPETEGTVNFTGEQLTYAELANKLGVKGYPANFFFRADGTLIGGQSGYMDPATFADLSEYIGDGHYTKYSFSTFQGLPSDKRR
jgi:thioredoxin-related protein